VLITYYLFPIYFDRRCDHHQANLQDYKEYGQTV